MQSGQQYRSRQNPDILTPVQTKNPESAPWWNQLLKGVWFQRIVFLLAIAFFAYYAFYYTLQGSTFFYTDPGRDMLLLDDMLTNKFSLIGARTSMTAVFHGPLWLYLNVPAYILGQGNPMALAWSWLVFHLLFLLSMFLVTRSIFDERAGWLATILMASSLVLITDFGTNPLGALYCVPVFIWTIWKYTQTQELRYLLLHFFIAGCCVSFEVINGVPLLILSLLYCTYHIVRTKKYLHFLSFLILVLPLSTFIVFELRHDFMQLRSILSYLAGDTSHHVDRDTAKVVMQRISVILNAGYAVFAQKGYEVFNVLVVGSIISFLMNSKKKLEHPTIVLLCCYFIGYVLITLLLKDVLLFHYYYPLFPIPIIIFAALHKHLNKYFYAAVYLLAVVAGAQLATQRVQFAENSIGQIEDDWQFLSTVMAKPFEGAESEFGYYLYTPDIYAYEQKYAMLYQTKRHPEKTVFRYEKKPVTYLVIAPAVNTGELLFADWKRDRVKIRRPADQEFMMAGGYRVEKYLLTPEELAEPGDSTLNDWIYFR